MNTARHFLSACLAISSLTFAKAEITGTVFEDRNGDGVRNEGEPGISGVAVSNGRDIVLTDAQGQYHLGTDSGAHAVFVVKPTGYSTALDPQLQPKFYARVGSEAAKTQTSGTDFPLRKADEKSEFRILAFTDVQPDSVEDVGYFERTLIDPLAGTKDFAFGVNLGDVANDHPDLYDKVAAALGRIGVPWHEVIGNHDIVVNGTEGGVAISAFEKRFGPSTYAFRYADTLFIALDNVRPIGGPRFIGGLTEEQFTFLENLLKITPKEDRVVVMTHIPWFSPLLASSETFRRTDRDKLFRLLQDHTRVLLLSGHTHAQRHVFYGKEDGWNGASPLHEYNVAAACGGFWGGPRDSEGIPLTTMWDGTPHGYGIVEFAPDRVRTHYRAARRPADDQIGLHAAVAARAGLHYVSFYANVYDGHEGWTVEGRVGQENLRPLQHIFEWDPSYAALYLAQDTDPSPPAGRRLPDPTICAHLWRGTLPATLAPGEYDVEVRATSPDGDRYSARQKIRIVGP